MTLTISYYAHYYITLQDIDTHNLIYYVHYYITLQDIDNHITYIT